MISPTGSVPAVPLRGDVTIPQLGFGVFQVPPRDTAAVTARALAAGYRHIDTARIYGNEAGVGEAVRASGLPREQLFVTTKCWNDDQGSGAARAAFAASAERLGIGVVDLYLIHWPVPAWNRYIDTWRTLIDLQAEGLARAIGVSNFQPAHLDRVVEQTGVVPAINQVELHPYLQQAELRRRHAELGIVTEAWSPLAQGAVLGDPVITALAGRHERSPAQIVLRWHLQLGNVVIPKSVTPARIAENFDLFGFALTDAQMGEIAGLDRGQRIGPDPDVFERP